MPSTPEDSRDIGPVQFFALGQRGLASSRLRAWGLSAALARTGVDSRCVVGPSAAGARAAFLGRMRDVAVVQKWVPPRAVLDRIRARARVLIYDVDDAIYLETGRSGSHDERDRTRLRESIGVFDAFTVSTHTIEADLRELAPTTPALVFPGPIALIDSAVDARPRGGAIWLGSPATEKYLVPWANALQAVDDRIGFTAIGATAATSGLARAEWSPEVERDLLSTASVGIFVQADGSWERRKSGYKILEYVAHSVLPVAQRRAAAEELLGGDYPFLFEQDLVGAVEAATALDAHQRRKLLESLRERISAFEFEAVADTWVRFVRSGAS